MNFRVLVGTPTTELEGSLTARFDELPDADIVSVHRSSRELADTVGRLPELDVVLIHRDLGPLPVLDLIRDLSHNHPQLAVLLVVDTVDPDTFTQAMEAGARGVISRDITLEELDTRVRAAADWSRTLRRHLEARALDLPVQSHQGSIIALSGAKGGVGTTTAAVHLAMAAARAGRVVCLVDLDLQTGDIPSYLDLKHRRGIADLVEAGDSISAAMLAETLYVHPKGPHILLAPDHGERGEDVDGRSTRQVLGSLRSRYELVIVDCGSTMNEATAMAAELADTAIVTVTPDLPALRGAQRLIAMWERLQIRSKDDVTALLIRHSRKNEIQPEFARKLLGTRLLKNVIPANYRAFEEGQNTGDPERVSDDAVRRSFIRLAEELDMGGRAARPTTGGGRDLSGFTEAGTPGHRAAGRGDGGGVIVEFATVVPFLLLALLLVWQVLLLGLTSMYAGHAASEGARQAAITPNEVTRIYDEAEKRVHEPWNGHDSMVVETVERGEDRFVAVSIVMPVVLPGVNGPWDITGEAKIVEEQSPTDPAPVAV